MKRIIYIVLSGFLILTSLTGCNNKDNIETSNEASAENEFVYEAKAEFDPTEDSPEEIMTEARYIYSWFETSRLNSYDDKYITDEESGSKRFKVLFSNLDTPDELRSYLQNYFSDDIAENLMNNGAYTVGEDGYLYTEKSEGSTDENIMSVEYTLSEISENECIFTAYVTKNDSNEKQEYRFDCAKIDGKWKFIEFPFFS